MKTSYNSDIIKNAFDKIGFPEVTAENYLLPVRAKKTFVMNQDVKIEAGTLFYLEQTMHYTRRDDKIDIRIKIAFPDAKSFNNVYLIRCFIDTNTKTVALNADNGNITFDELIEKVDPDTAQHMTDLYKAYHENGDLAKKRTIITVWNIILCVSAGPVALSAIIMLTVLIICGGISFNNDTYLAIITAIPMAILACMSAVQVITRKKAYNDIISILDTEFAYIADLDKKSVTQMDYHDEIIMLQA